jgi:hypothetical protein
MKAPLIALVSIMLVAACATVPGVSSTGPHPTIPPISPAIELTVVHAVASATTSPGCYYVWAMRELPDLSRQLNVALQTLEPSLTGSAYAYGEDCVWPDGTRTFSTMETDFRARVLIRGSSDEETLGNWIIDVMRIIDTLPPGDVPGAHPGRVEFEFYKSKSETLRLNVDIAKYLGEASGLPGAQLYRLFLSTP